MVRKTFVLSRIAWFGHAPPAPIGLLDFLAWGLHNFWSKNFQNHHGRRCWCRWLLVLEMLLVGLLVSRLWPPQVRDACGLVIAYSILVRNWYKIFSWHPSSSCGVLLPPVIISHPIINCNLCEIFSWFPSSLLWLLLIQIVFKLMGNPLLASSCCHFLFNSYSELIWQSCLGILLPPVAISLSIIIQIWCKVCLGPLSSSVFVCYPMLTWN